MSVSFARRPQGRTIQDTDHDQTDHSAPDGALAKIRDEAQTPIVLLFDECDVLAKSRIHLQKLRNAFMNVPGYMLVFTGTPALFPVMDEVFSPIIRQFKKICTGPT